MSQSVVWLTILPGHLDLSLRAGAKPDLVTRTLIVALVLVDDPAPEAWRRCRAAALRYLEAARRARVGPAVALRHVEAAARRWTAPELSLPVWHRLMTALEFWVGTAYQLRWRRSDDDALSVRMLAATALARHKCDAAAVILEQSRAHCGTSQALRDQVRALRTPAVAHAGRQG